MNNFDNEPKIDRIFENFSNITKKSIIILCTAIAHHAESTIPFEVGVEVRPS